MAWTPTGRPEAPRPVGMVSTGSRVTPIAQHHAVDTGDRLERGSDRIGWASCFQGDHPLSAKVGELIVERDFSSRDDDHSTADGFHLR